MTATDTTGLAVRIAAAILFAGASVTGTVVGAKKKDAKTIITSLIAGAAAGGILWRVW